MAERQLRPDPEDLSRISLKSRVSSRRSMKASLGFGMGAVGLLIGGLVLGYRMRRAKRIYRDGLAAMGRAEMMSQARNGFQVHYSFQHQGMAYRGSDSTKWPVSNQVWVLYDPSDPRQSLLAAESTSGAGFGYAAKVHGPW